MNSKSYIDGIQSLSSIQSVQDDIEPGLLSELRMDAPESLHSNIMSEIRNEKKKKFYMNYRIYMPIAAAVLVAAIFVNGGKNFINQLYAEKPIQNVVHSPQTETNSVTPTPAVNGITDNTQSNIVASNEPTKTITVAPSNKTTVKDSGKTASAVKKPSVTEQNKSTASKNANDKAPSANTGISGKDIVASSGSDSTSQNLEKDSNINLEITASNQSEVINFLKNYGTLTDDGKSKIYKLSTSYLNQLNSLLGNGTAEGKVVNANCSEDDFIIKLVVNE